MLDFGGFSNTGDIGFTTHLIWTCQEFVAVLLSPRGEARLRSINRLCTNELINAYFLRQAVCEVPFVWQFRNCRRLVSDGFPGAAELWL